MTLDEALPYLKKGYSLFRPVWDFKVWKQNSYQSFLISDTNKELFLSEEDLNAKDWKIYF